jgi:signal transduction histidine kinase
MGKRISFETIFLKENATRLTRSEYKRLMLTGYLSLVSILVSIAYAITDISNQVYYSLPAYLLLFSSAIVVAILLRNEMYSLAKIMLMVNANLVVFYSALNDPFATGTCMLFIPAGTGSFAILGFKERTKAILLALFSASLFAIAFSGNIQIVNTTPSESYIRFSFILNFVLSLSIVVSILYFLGNLNEASELELIEQEKSERGKNEELKKINTELDQFVYSVSHDLRSPLSSIQGLVNIGKNSVDEEEMRKCFGLIEDRVKAQYFFINEIIEIYRNNRAELKTETVNLKRLVQEVVKETSFESGASEIQFRMDISDDLTIEADKIRLRSILFNLIGKTPLNTMMPQKLTDR